MSRVKTLLGIVVVIETSIGMREVAVSRVLPGMRMVAIPVVVIAVRKTGVLPIEGVGAVLGKRGMSLPISRVIAGGCKRVFVV
jgi:hypothetical protein